MLAQICFLWFIFPTLWAVDHGSEIVNPKEKRATGKFGPSIAEFGKDLMKVLLEEAEENENLLMSPITIHKLMSMLYIGSPKESTTFKQLDKALHLTSDQRELKAYRKIVDQYAAISNQKRGGSTTLRLAGTMIMKDGFTVKDDFKGHMKKYFSATTKIFSTPAEGVSLVNDWAEEKTKGMIKEILKKGDVTSDTMLILASASYFKSDWKTKFNKSDTKPMDFTLGRENKVQIEKGMNMFKTDFKYAETDDYKVLELPYKNPDFSMYIALPKEKGMEALNKVASGFCTQQFSDKLWSRSIAHLQMPSFDATSEIDLAKPLKALGIKDAFTDAADFSNIAERELKVGKVKTKTVVKVDEAGSEAAAVAVATFETKSGVLHPPKPLKFIVNRPFVFMIHDQKRKVPLFIGRVVNPQEN